MKGGQIFAQLLCFFALFGIFFQFNYNQRKVIFQTKISQLPLSPVKYKLLNSLFLPFFFALQSPNQDERRKKKEAKLARILILIVFFFLFCNICKVALTAYDLIGLDVNQLRICEEYKLQYKFPLWVKVMNSANHMFLVMNASGNIFLFIVTGTQVNTKVV